MDYALLTGQTRYTIEFFSPIRNIWNRARDWIRASTTAAGITWMSKFVYFYHRLMLHNLSPRSPATENWPLYMYPPPHFLVGYQFIVRICNDYIFDVRSYSRIKYHEILGHHQQLINWSMLANCSYTVNTGAYHRFIDLDNFEQTLIQVQQSIIADRIVADLALINPMTGFGISTIQNENVPIERLIQESYKNLGECQDQIWGLAERIHIQRSSNVNLIILSTIRKLKAAYFNFLISDDEKKLSLPCDCDWLDAFVEFFGSSLEEGSQHLKNIETQKLLKAVVSALTLPMPFSETLTGGAFELRPREDGRAVTEVMRRRRGEIIERFIDRLPVRRRRRRARIEIEDIEEEPRSFADEVRDSIATIIRLLEEEIQIHPRNHQFFHFAVNFYNVMQRLQASGYITETIIRRWVMYFFVLEHIATTLNYLQRSFRENAAFNRHVEILLAQVVMRGRDDDGNVIYSRIWNETGIDSFPSLMSRISLDLSAMVERAGYEGFEEEEIEQFMADIDFHENSGDVQEVLTQAAVNDSEINSVEISFRFKVMGPVIFSQKKAIQSINRRVITLASQMRQQGLPLPEHNQNVPLPLD